MDVVLHIIEEMGQNVSLIVVVVVVVERIFQMNFQFLIYRLARKDFSFYEPSSSSFRSSVPLAVLYVVER